jgi:hypothetical protein
MVSQGEARMGGQGDPFEASAATIGYLFQLRQALSFCVEQLALGLDWSVAIEAGDDIEVQRDDTTSLWQLKHRALGTKLTDTATDLWKSIRIWATALPTWGTEYERLAFFLLTTADAPVDSAAYYLRPPGTASVRDETKALQLLREARAASSNKALKPSFEAWDELAPQQCIDLLARIQVIDAAPDIDQTTALLNGRAALAVGHDKANAFLQRLDGWFLQRVTEMLRDRSVCPVTGLEFDRVFTDHRNQFRPDNLPIDTDIIDLDADDDRSNQTFVRQLDLAGVGDARIRRAIRDYLRAFAQRSRWSNDNLLHPGELGTYERRLVEEWETRFDIMVDELGEDVAEDDKRREARAIYAWVELEARIPIRPGCDEPFVTKGSYQLLANDLRVGAPRLPSSADGAARTGGRPMTLMSSWSHEERALFNPAFTALVSARVVQGHATKFGYRCPLPIVVTAAVMALQPAVRALLPGTTNASMPKWAEDTEQIRVHMATNAPALSEVVRPGVLFALQMGILAVESAGLILQRRVIPATVTGATPTVVAVQKAAHMLGRWLPTAGDTAMVLTLLGVRP